MLLVKLGTLQMCRRIVKQQYARHENEVATKEDHFKRLFALSMSHLVLNITQKMLGVYIFLLLFLHRPYNNL